MLGQVQYVSSVADACHLLLERLLRSNPAERAAVVLRTENTVRSVGYGIPDDRLQAITEGEAAQRLWDLTDEGVERLGEEVDLPPELGIERPWIMPLPGPRGIPCGLVLMEWLDGIQPDPELARIVQEVGPIISRIFETEVLRERLQRLENRNQLLGTIVDSMADPVVLTDHRNNFVFTNRRAEQLFHAGAGENEGRRRAIRINDLLFSSFLTQAVISGGEPVSRELNLVDPADGSDLLFEVLTIPLPSSVEMEGAVISVLRDITDLKRALTELEVQFNRSRVAERQARRESDRLNVILGNVGDPILVTDEDSRIMLMNAEADRLFDPSSSSAGEEARRRFRANDTKFTTLVSDFLLQQEVRRVDNLMLTDPATGEEFPVEVVSSKIEGPRGDISAIVSILHDLTQVVENERLARELQVLNEELEERIRLATEELEERNRRLEWQSRELQKASRLKSEFLASMSHELRTPINAMLGYTSLLQERIYGEVNDKQENALTKIQGASEHLLALINDILDLSKIEAGRMPIRVERVELETLVGELSQTIEPMLKEKGLEYRMDLDPTLAALTTDRTKVKQILLNLLSNAVKFTSEGSITLRARLMEGGQEVRLEVQDTGIGIDREELDAIFDDFRQVDQSPTRRFGGTGLGLSITRKLVDLMGGRIAVESDPGEGSTFRVELPTRLEVQDPEEEEPVRI